MTTIFLIWFLYAVISFLMLPGVALVFFPIFPAMFYLWVLALTYGFVDGWQHLSLTIFSVLSAIFIISFAIDFFSGLLGAKLFGASKKAILGAIFGGLLGVIILPPFGALPGIFLGVLIVELLQAKDHANSLKAASGAMLGAMTGMIINFCLALSFLLLFTISVLLEIL